MCQAVPTWYTAGRLPTAEDTAVEEEDAAASDSSSDEEADAEPQQVNFDVLEGDCGSCCAVAP